MLAMGLAAAISLQEAGSQEARVELLKKESKGERVASSQAGMQRDLLPCPSLSNRWAAEGGEEHV